MEIDLITALTNEMLYCPITPGMMCTDCPINVLIMAADSQLDVRILLLLRLKLKKGITAIIAVKYLDFIVVKFVQDYDSPVP